MKSAIIKAVANGTHSVYALTHTRELGEGRDIKEELMLLVYEGILVDYDDGRKVRLA